MLQPVLVPSRSLSFHRHSQTDICLLPKSARIYALHPIILPFLLYQNGIEWQAIYMEIVYRWYAH